MDEERRYFQAVGFCGCGLKLVIGLMAEEGNEKQMRGHMRSQCSTTSLTLYSYCCS